MTNKKLFFALILSAVMCVPFTTSAQVTIGSGNPPSEWSLLYLCTYYQQKALHNARMTTDQRNTLMCYSDLNIHSLEDQTRAQGLMIFNTDAMGDVGCLEFWNGRQWISLCTERLSPPFYPTPSDNAHATTLVNVMYDFQAQPLQVFYESAARPASWQWQWSYIDNNNDNNAWTNIAGAQDVEFTQSDAFWHASWVLPANFIHNVVMPAMTNRQGNLYFRAVLVVENEHFASNTIQIRFVQTTYTGNNDFLPGFGMGADGIRYAELGRAVQTAPVNSGGIIRVALLNVGANDFDGGLGSIFQWGRLADGHQLIGWFNDPATRNTTFASGVSNGFISTSGTTPWTGNVTDLGHPTPATPDFILATPSGPGNSDWGAGHLNLTSSRDLWGSGTTFTGSGSTAVSQNNSVTRASAPVISTAWRVVDNNPCPDGWRVPSQWEWFDMTHGDGTSNPGPAGSANLDNTFGGNREWTQRVDSSGALGGVIVRNTDNNAVVFLPAAGWRATQTGMSGLLEVDNRRGFYWSSTHLAGHTAALLTINMNQNFITLAGAGARASGLSVRCVKD